MFLVCPRLFVLCPVCVALDCLSFGADANAKADADAAAVARPSVVSHAAVCDSLREPPPFVLPRPFRVLPLATCYSCSIYCVFLMSKLHFIMSLVRGKAAKKAKLVRLPHMFVRLAKGIAMPLLLRL